jgi:chromosome segregation ATPase
VDRLHAESSDLQRRLAAAEDAAATSAAEQSADVAHDLDGLAFDNEELRAENAALEERLSGAEADIAELRLNHKRELRAKGREAGQVQEELRAARAQLRDLRAKNRDLHAVRSSHRATLPIAHNA